MNKLMSRTLMGLAVIGVCGLPFAARAAAPAHAASAAALTPAQVKAQTLRSARAPDKGPKALPEPVLPQLAAEAIVERNAQARGGAAAWARINTMLLSGKLDAGRERKDGGNVGGLTATPRQARLDKRAEVLAAAKAGTPQGKVIQLPFRLELQRPVKQRMEVDFKGQTALQVWDGSVGWKFRPFMGRKELEAFTPQETQIAAAQQPLDGPLLNHAAKGIRVEADGTETVDGKDCYRLKLTLTGGEQRRTWIDARTFLEVMTEDAPRHFNGKDRRVTTHFRDYKAVDGLLVAHQLETQVEGVPQTNKIYVEQVAFRSGLDAARFMRPDRLQ